MAVGQMSREKRQRWPRERRRTKQEGWVREKSGEKEEGRPAGLVASSSSSLPCSSVAHFADRVPSLPVCIIVFVHIVLCMILVRLRSRGGAP